ncbi:hypothetical protein [Pelagicoccus albus]|uniref:Uncharacterized protein n=1 Tax=Pelagicoccus albus TaxID=415222 RepID=A0A7X1E8D0_9BACT|nr:hypothetical protein [Pelagicoccus albus]MBC2606680.1 hypothetical protein [Pelagicoccus albus]
MKSLPNEKIGILPAGALGVAFAAHLSSGFQNSEGIFFLPRSDSKSLKYPQIEYELLLETANGVESVKTPPSVLPPLPELEGEPPGIILAGPMPDQLFCVLRDLVEWLTQTTSRFDLDTAVENSPILVMTSNGIYFQRLRRYFLEILEEAEMLGSLPDLWPDKMPILVGKLLRGVTIQTGLRKGSGSQAIYRPGPSGRTTLVGGDAEVREAVRAHLQRKGMLVSANNQANPTRIEFDKATVNLAGNLFGQILSIDEDGAFQKITIAETHQLLPPSRMQRLVETLVSIGKAVRAYPSNYQSSESFEFLEKATAEHASHVASSVQLLEARINDRSLRAELPPTEAWLLEPLLNFARAKNLEEEEAFLTSLKEQLITAFKRAIAYFR